MEGFLHDFLVNVNLDHHAVRILEDLVSAFLQNPLNGAVIRSLGNGCHHIPVLVKNSQPGSHAVWHLAHKPGVYLVAIQLADHFLAHGIVIHQTDKCGLQLYIGNILYHISSHSAVDLLDHSRISSAWNKRRCRIPFHIDKNITDYNNSHTFSFSFVTCYIFTIISVTSSLKDLATRSAVSWTSLWFNSSFEIPAAMLVMQEIPQISRPM